MDAEQEQIALDKVVRHHVYDYVMREGLPPHHRANIVCALALV